jgi:hypothetical protein
MLSNDYNLFVSSSHGAVIASIAHLLRHRILNVTIASSESVFDSAPWGSSPLLDPHYSSADLTVRHDSACFTRLEKIRVVSQWPEGLAVLRVCHDLRRGRKLNCERCEKCMRTMVGLVICGKLAESDAFDVDDVTVDQLESLNTPATEGELPLRLIHHLDTWREMLEPLREIDRTDLAAVIERKLSEVERGRSTSWRRDWKRLVPRALRRLARVMAGQDTRTTYR